PLGYVLIARGETVWYAGAETLTSVLKVFLAVLLLRYHGLVGTAIAYPVLYACYTVGMLLVIRYRSGFTWNRSVVKLLLVSAVLVALGFGLSFALSSLMALI